VPAKKRTKGSRAQTSSRASSVPKVSSRSDVSARSENVPEVLDDDSSNGPNDGAQRHCGDNKKQQHKSKGYHSIAKPLHSKARTDLTQAIISDQQLHRTQKLEVEQRAKLQKYVGIVLLAGAV